MHKVQDLRIYQLALNLSVDVYKLTKDFPTDEKYGLISQFRRSTSSIGANIAEGYNRKTDKDRTHFMIQAKASLSESIFHLDLSLKLEYIDEKSYENLLKDFINLDVKIHNYIQYINKS